ncbi:MAG: DUF2721 domain-containing protein [Fibrobacterota bacterium]
MTVTTPALLFPAISLLLLAYTNRFLVLAQLVRTLHEKEESRTKRIAEQISNLRIRLRLIRYMQTLGVLAFLFCTLSMFALFLTGVIAGEILFGIALSCLLISLAFSLWEISISTKALSYELSDLHGRYPSSKPADTI